MKKGKGAAVVLVTAALLTACGGAADASVTTEEIVVPEMSSKDIIVNSLEYLLEEDGQETAAEDGTEEEHAEEGTQPGQEAATVIYYGKDSTSGLTEETVTVEEVTPDVLIGALARHNIVPLLDTRVLSFQEKELDGRKVLYLDLSDAFGEYLMTMSREAEAVIISSVANTFLTNYNADAIHITVEGEILITSHKEYTEALPGYTPEEMLALLTAAGDEEEEK